MLKRIRENIRRESERLLEPSIYDETLVQLVEEGVIKEPQAAKLKAQLPEQLQSSAYTLKHLGAHLGIGVVFAFDVVPLPLGTISRILWVAGARLVETVRREPERAKVHSASVLLIAAIPWFGYAAYLLPLRRNAPELTFVLANHTWLRRTGVSYEARLAQRKVGSLRHRFGRWLIPIPSCTKPR